MSRRRSIWAILAVLAVWLAVVGQRRLETRDYVLDGVVLLAGAAGLFVLSLVRGHASALPLWPLQSPGAAEAESDPLVPERMRRPLLVVVALLAVVAFASLADNLFTLRGVLSWAGVVAAWLLVAARLPPRSVLDWVTQIVRARDVLRARGLAIRVSWVTVILLAILLLSFVFHVYRIASTPAEAQSDHVEAAEDVRSILSGQYMIFFPRNTGREATQFYLTALLSHIFGYSFTTLKLTMALVGTLNVIPMYLLGKELVDRRFGLLAAFFMAVSCWHVIVSRIGWRIVLAPFWTTVTLYLLLRSFRTGRRNDYLLTGLSLGAGLYGYMSFRVTPLLIAALFALKALLERSQGFDRKRFLANGGLLVVTSMLVYLPMFRYMYDEPRMFWYRVLTRTTDLERTVQRPLPVFLDNVKRALLMFNWTGDGAWPTSIPWRAALDYVSGGLLVLGAAYVLYLLLARRRPIALYLLVAMFITLLPSTLAIAFPIENPSNIRASGVIPLIVVLIALPVYLVARQVMEALRGGTGVVLAIVVCGLLLVQATRLNYRLYFVEYDMEYRRAAWNASDLAGVMMGFANSLGSIYDAYYIGTAYWVDHRAIALTMRNMEWNNLIMDMAQAEPHLAAPRNRLYILHPSNVQALQWLREHYPSGRLMRFQASLPDKDFLIFLALAEL